MADKDVCCPPSAPAPKGPHPVAKKSDYEPQGTFEAIDNFDEVYVTGPDNAEHAIVVIYDIFGFWDTTIRGSDLLVSHLLLTHPHKVFMPDLFHGSPLPPSKDGNKEEMGKFFAGTANLQKGLGELKAFAENLSKKFKTVSLLGYCWGGKLTFMALSDPSTHIRCGAAVHPAMLEDADGDKLAKPIAFYPSIGEPADVVKHIAGVIERKPFAKDCDYHLYASVHHGWAAARADLANPENKKQFDDVYQRLAEYFARVDL